MRASPTRSGDRGGQFYRRDPCGPWWTLRHTPLPALCGRLRRLSRAPDGPPRGLRNRLGADGSAGLRQLHGLHTFPLACIGRPAGIQVVSDIADLLAHDGGHYGAIEASLAGVRDEPATPRVEVNARLPVVPAGGGNSRTTYATTRRTEGGLRGRLWVPESPASRPQRSPAISDRRRRPSIVPTSSPSCLPYARPRGRRCAPAARH